jgi:AbiV family abortive infection protein
MAKNKVITTYSGPLTVAQAAEGIRLALVNARTLLADAELLLQHERWPRAASLAALAIEESGKQSLIRSLLLSRNEEERRLEWRNYRTHVQKNLAWILPQLVSEGARTLEDLRPIFSTDSDHGNILDSVKQLGFYSDAYGNCHWSDPQEVVGRHLAETLVMVARILVPKTDAAMTTEGELELWVKHLKPVWKGDIADMKKALLACYAEAEALGVLKGNSSAKEMVKFIL